VGAWASAPRTAEDAREPRCFVAGGDERETSQVPKWGSDRTYWGPGGRGADRISCSWGGDGPPICRDPGGKSVRVPELADAVALAVDEGSTCLIDGARQLVCWARCPYVPARRVIFQDAVDLRQAHSHTCARSGSGKVVCWGDPRALGAPADADGFAVTIPSGAVQLEVVGYHGCARFSDGRVTCWGVAAERPTERVTSARDLALGRSWGCALTGADAMTCWLLRSGSPGPITIAVPRAEQVVMGDSHVCVRSRDGRVHCGKPSAGLTSLEPVAELSDATHLTAHADLTCAERRAGPEVCWGIFGYDGCLPIESARPVTEAERRELRARP